MFDDDDDDDDDNNDDDDNDLLFLYLQDLYVCLFAGETVVHLFDPDFIKVVYLNEGKIPHIPPLVATTQMYRKYRGLSPGLGNTYEHLYTLPACSLMSK